MKTAAEKEAREMHLFLYGMFLVVSDTQPDIKLKSWIDRLAVIAGAEEYDEWLELTA